MCLPLKTSSWFLTIRLDIRSQDRAQRAHEFINLFSRDDERRQESQHRVMRAVDDESAIKQLFDVILAGNREIHGQHQAASPHFLHDGKVLEFFEPTLEIRSGLPDVLEQLFVLEDLDV